MKLENNCVVFEDGYRHETFHVTDVESLHHYTYSANGALVHKIDLLRKTSPSGSSTYTFELPEGISIQEITQFINSVCIARRDFNFTYNPIPIN